MVGATRVKGIDVGNYGTDYSLTNKVFRNGISYEWESETNWLGNLPPWRWLPPGWSSPSHSPSLRVGLANTRITGDDVFIDNYWDFSLSLATSSRQANKKMRVDFAYTHGNHGYRGGRLNVRFTY